MNKSLTIYGSRRISGTTILYPSWGYSPSMCIVRVKTEEEIMKHAELHEKEAHGKELSPEDEKKIKANIKTVKT
jgi:predicted small metal-binding protein